jgi:hypothetical protein
VKDGKSLYQLDDTDPNSSRMKKFAKEQAFREDYFKKNGREWVGFHPRGPPKHFMHPAENVGDTYVINTAAGHYMCDPTIDKSGACTGPEPGNTTVTIEVSKKS